MGLRWPSMNCDGISVRAALFSREQSTIVMAFRHFFFDKLELSKIVLQKAVKSAKDNNTTHTGLNANRIQRIPDITHTGYNVSWRIFQC